jgi:hypothetical protein
MAYGIKSEIEDKIKAAFSDGRKIISIDDLVELNKPAPMLVIDVTEFPLTKIDYMPLTWSTDRKNRNSHNKAVYLRHILDKCGPPLSNTDIFYDY